jgi:hypothetical protein
MGTPHSRWREMHQSGRVAIMLPMRSSPQAGYQRTFLIASSVRSRSRPSPSRAMNHCSVARKMIGFLHRQQIGYEWASFPAWTSTPFSRMNSTIAGFASNTFFPAKCSTSGRKRPASSTGQ